MNGVKMLLPVLYPHFLNFLKGTPPIPPEFTKKLKVEIDQALLSTLQTQSTPRTFMIF
jgi:hypothetical protein